MERINPVILKTAVIEDIFHNDQLIENKVFFEYSKMRNCYDGPYSICISQVNEKYWIEEFAAKVYAKMVFVPWYEGTSDSIEIQAAFRLATPDDIKESKSELKINTSIFLRINDELNGPFIITADTNVNDLKTHLDNKSMFVLDYASEQRHINKFKKAS